MCASAASLDRMPWCKGARKMSWWENQSRWQETGSFLNVEVCVIFSQVVEKSRWKGTWILQSFLLGAAALSHLVTFTVGILKEGGENCVWVVKGVWTPRYAWDLIPWMWRRDMFREWHRLAPELRRSFQKLWSYGVRDHNLTRNLVVQCRNRKC